MPGGEEFYYLDENGKKRDAELHDEILAGGDHLAALKVSRQVLRDLGLNPDVLLPLPVTPPQAKRFDPSQPRDETGKWTDGGGSDGGDGDLPRAGGPPSKVSNPAAYAKHRAMVEDVVANVAADRGYDPDLVEVSDKVDGIKIGGRPSYAAGVANIKTGKITMFPRVINNAQHARGTMVHEVAHQEFQAVLNAQAEQLRAALADKTVKFDKDNNLDAASAKKYPIAARFQKHSGKARETRMVEDGVTPYSEQWWGQAYTDKTKVMAAQHETIAEMARIEDETGTLPGHESWKSYYQDVMKTYRELKGKT